MEFSYATELAFPVSQIVLLMILSTGALLFRRLRLALLLNYLFTMYWGYVYNRHLFSSVHILDGFTAAYFGLGAAIALLAAIGFLASAD